MSLDSDVSSSLYRFIIIMKTQFRCVTEEISRWWTLQRLESEVKGVAEDIRMQTIEQYGNFIEEYSLLALEMIPSCDEVNKSQQTKITSNFNGSC